MTGASSVARGATRAGAAGTNVTDDPLLELRDLHVTYEGVHALAGLDLVVAEGELVVLLGPNGAGKSTTLRAVSGLVRPSGGTVLIDGERANGWSGTKVASSGVAHVPEGRRIFSDHTVLENLQLGAFLLRRKRGLAAEQLEEVFALFPRLADRAQQMAGTLSGGEAQMLAVARALMSRPRLLMLDEPSLGLAPRLVAEMFGYLTRLNREQNLTILLVEQAATLALRLAHRGYVLEHGRAVISGPASELRDDVRVRRVYLGGATEGASGDTDPAP